MSRASGGALAVAVLVTAGSVYALSGSAEPSPPQAETAQVVATAAAALACPESPQTDHTATTVVAVTPVAAPADMSAAADSDAGASLDPGSLSIRALGGSSDPIDQTSAVGEPLVHELSTSQQPSVVVDGVAGMAPGASAFQYSEEDGKNHSGRSVSSCGEGSDDWWFNGADTAVGSTSRLVVTNTTPSLAVADIVLYGPKGPIETVGQRGIALAPDSRVSLDLARFAPDLDALTVNVHATAGLVTAAVETTRVDGVTPAGSEWLPPSSAPATDVVVDPAVDNAASQNLQIVNPDDVGALVQVQVVEDGGPFVPSGLDSVRVDPGSVKTIPLGKVTHNGAAAVRLTSSIAVTGAVVSIAKGDADYAVSAPSALLADSAVVPVFPDVDYGLGFTGVSQQSTGRFAITGFDASGDEVFADSVTVDGLRTASWTPPDAGSNKGSKQPVYLVVTPKLDTDVQAIAAYSDKDGVATLPLAPGVFTVTRPSVAPQR
jgi:hypothetical protein